MVLSAIGEALLALSSDRLPRRWFVCGGLAVLAAALSLCSVAREAWTLSLGLALAGTASGAACSAAQAELVVRAGPDRALTRWTTFAAAGDVLAPLAVALALAHGESYRTVLAGVAVVLGVQALVAWRSLRAVPATTPAASPESAGADDEDAERPPTRELVHGARNPRLWLWLAAASLCTLLDELAAALAALHLRADLGSTEAAAAASLTVFSLGALAGAALTDALVARFSWRTLLGISGVAAALAIGGFLVSSSAITATIALGVLGAAVAPHYPLTKARAYEAAPGRPGLVNALAQVFVVVDVGAPLLLGWIADARGLSVAFACLLLQPVALAALALIARERPRDPASG